MEASATVLLPRDNGKGKAVVHDVDDSTSPLAKPESALPVLSNIEKDDKDHSDLGPLVIFSCRHVFHRTCLEEMQTTEARQRGSEESRTLFSCTLCT